MSPIQKSRSAISFNARRVVSNRSARRLEDSGDLIALRQPMIARHPVMRPAQSLVIAQIRKPARLGPEPNAVRKHAGQKQRMICQYARG